MAISHRWVTGSSYVPYWRTTSTETKEHAVAEEEDDTAVADDAGDAADSVTLLNDSSAIV